MQEIKQNFKLEQIQLLDLIDFFDRRANSRRHEPSPEYEIDSPPIVMLTNILLVVRL